MPLVALNPPTTADNQVSFNLCGAYTSVSSFTFFPDVKTLYVPCVEGQTVRGGSVSIGNATASVTLLSSPSVSYTLTLPSNAGSNGYLLSTNGDGVLSWVESAVSMSDFTKFSNV